MMATNTYSYNYNLMKEDYFNSSTILSSLQQILHIMKTSKSYERLKVLLLKDNL